MAIDTRLASEKQEHRKPDLALRPVPVAVAAGALLPNLLVGAMLFIAPIAIIMLYAVGTLDFTTLEVQWGWTLASIREVLQEPYLSTLLYSVGFSLAAVVACAIPGFAIAQVMVNAPGRWRNLLIVLVIFPFWTSFIVRTYAWTDILGPRGVIADVTGRLGHEVVLLGTLPGILVGMISAYLPMMVFPIFVALERVPKVLTEAARDLGAGEWRILRTVLIPGAAPGIAAGALLVGIPACGEYVVPEVLGRGKIQLLGNVIGRQMQEDGNYPLGAALTVSLLGAMLLMLAAVWVFRRLIERNVA